MIAGKMKYRLRLFASTATADIFGEDAPEFAPCGEPVWAQRVRLTGVRSEEAGEHFADYRAEFNVRSAHPVKAGWRVQPLGGDEVFNVVAVVPNLDRGMLTLVCERLNP